MWFVELIFDETYLCLIIMQKYPHYVNAFFVLHFYVCNKIIIVQNSSIILCFLLLFLSRGATSPNGGTRLRRQRARLRNCDNAASPIPSGGTHVALTGAGAQPEFDDRGADM